MTKGQKLFLEVRPTYRTQGFFNRLKNVNPFPNAGEKYATYTSTPLLQAHSTDTVNPQLGLGYNTFTGAILNGNCLVSTLIPGMSANPITQTVNPSSNITSSVTVSYSQLVTSMSAAGSVSGSYDGFAASAQVSYATTLTTTDFSVCVVVTGYTNGTTEYNLTDYTQIFNSSTTYVDSVEGVSNFTSVYGDQFISTVTTGAQYCAVFVLNCSSASMQTDMAASISASMQTAGASASGSASYACSQASSTYNIAQTFSYSIWGYTVTQADIDAVPYSLTDPAGAEDWAARINTVTIGANNTGSTGTDILGYTTTLYESLAGFPGITAGTDTYWPVVENNRSVCNGPTIPAGSTAQLAVLSPPITLWQMCTMLNNVYNANLYMSNMYAAYGVTTITLPTTYISQVLTDLTTVTNILANLGTSPAGTTVVASTVYNSLVSLYSAFSGTIVASAYISPTTYPSYTSPNSNMFPVNDTAFSFVGAGSNYLSAAGLIPPPGESSCYFEDAVISAVSINQVISTLQTFGTGSGYNSGYQLNVQLGPPGWTTSTLVTEGDTVSSYGTGQAAVSQNTAVTIISIFTLWDGDWSGGMTLPWYIRIDYADGSYYGGPSALTTTNNNLAFQQTSTNYTNFSGGVSNSLAVPGLINNFGYQTCCVAWSPVCNSGFNDTVGNYGMPNENNVTSLQFTMPANTSTTGYAFLGFSGWTTNFGMGSSTQSIFAMLPIIAQMPLPTYNITTTVLSIGNTVYYSSS